MESPIIVERRVTPVTTHGKLDTIISIEEGRTTRKKLINLGFHVDYYEYNIGHEINLEILSELSKWL